ncbi:hypothetical protein OIU79_008280 [Salix purpurea]|uniref:Uncharacterized protein n=1 Tax=Salix purpurea TaxID=77065 RepID=A0A9Q0TI01_SALPP|nr:hypothetical protein OIU79_008280 [Salix purpurea]
MEKLSKLLYRVYEAQGFTDIMKKVGGSGQRR